MAASFKHPRGTRAALNTLAGANGLIPYQIYYISDESRLAMATANNSYIVFSQDTDIAIPFIIDGGGATIASNSKVDLPDFPFAATIQRWTITADQSSSAVVDILRSTYANFPTMASIAGTAKPTLSSVQKAQNTTLTGWGNTALAKGDVLRANVDSVTSAQRLAVTLWVRRA